MDSCCSTEARWLWLIMGRDTLVSAPVAIGMGTTFDYNGKSYQFSTPRGKWLGLVVFGPETSVGIVQLFFEQLVEQLAAAAPRDQPVAPVLPEDFEHELDASLKALFGR